MRRAQQLGLAAGGALFAGATFALLLDRVVGVPDPLSDVALAAGFLSITLVPITLLATIPLIDPDPGDPAALPPEAVTPTRRCGATVDRYRSAVFPPAPATRVRLAARLRRAAVAALVEERGHTRDSAREAIARGDWTDDPRAARLLAGGVDAIGDDAADAGAIDADAADTDAPSAILFTYSLRAATGEIDAILEGEG